MSTTSVSNNLASSLTTLIQEIQSRAPANAGNTGSSNFLSAIESSSAARQSDTSQVSPLAQVLSDLQQIQQSDSTKYAQVTSQIATNLQNAAQTALSDGNSAAATQLNQLSQDFKTASTTGQLPNIQDLAQAIGGGGHHHHHHASAASGSDSTSDSSTASSTSSQDQSSSLNPLSIIQQTLSSSGLSSSNS